MENGSQLYTIDHTKHRVSALRQKTKEGSTGDAGIYLVCTVEGEFNVLKFIIKGGCAVPQRHISTLAQVYKPEVVSLCPRVGMPASDKGCEKASESIMSVPCKPGTRRV